MSSRADVSSDIDAIIKLLGQASKELLANGGGFTSYYLGLLRDADAGLHTVLVKSLALKSKE